MSWDARGELREVRRTTTASAPPVEASAHHTSLGRLLRLVGDPRSNDFHIEAAIAHVEATRSLGVRGLLDAAPQEESTRLASRVLSLSDHRHISNLETVLRVVEQSVAAIGSSASGERSSSRASRGEAAAAAGNLLSALASAMVTQCVDECSSTKANVCAWSQQSKKRLLLLEWIIGLSQEASTVLIEEVLAAGLSRGKADQLAVSLVTFELAQRSRRNGCAGNADWARLVSPLMAVVKNGSIPTASGPKPNQLGIAALDALFAALCISKAPLNDNRRVLDGMKLALATLKQWKAGSPRGRWASIAATHLMSLLAISDSEDATGSLEMVVWHWNTCAMWLCSRSDCVLTARKNLLAAIQQTMDKVYALTNARDGTAISLHTFCATLMRLCSLLSLRGEIAEHLKKTNTPGKLLVSLALELANPATSALVIQVLRLCIFGSAEDSGARLDPLLSVPKSDLLSFISLARRSFMRPDDVSTEVFSLLAEICLQFGITADAIFEADASATVFSLTIVEQTLICYTRVYAADPGLMRHWLHHTTKTVLRVLQGHPIKSARDLAARLVPKLDQVLVMKHAASKLLEEVKNTTANQLIVLLFERAENHKVLIMELASTLVDTLCRGTMRSSTFSTPRDFGRQHENDQKGLQAPEFSFFTHGWPAHVNHSTKTAIVTALMHKVFGSPRDSVYITWLRELSLLGWFGDAIADILPAIIAHAKNLDELTEELLQEESSRSTRAIEHLLFARLAPNLILRVIPRTLISKLLDTSTLLTRCGALTLDEPSHSCDSSFELVKLLWRQILNPLEFKEVKMLSAELLTKLPVAAVLPDVLNRLAAFLHSRGASMDVVKILAERIGPPEDGSFVVAKLLVYYLNLIFTDDSTAVVEADLFERSLIILLTVLSLPCSPNDAFSVENSPLVDLQMGAIECLALLLSKSLTKADGTGIPSGDCRVEEALIEVFFPGSVIMLNHGELGGNLFQQWLAVMRSSRTVTETLSTKQLHVCCANTLLSALAKLDSSGLHRFQERILQSHLLRQMDVAQPPHILAPCLQILFSFVFKAGTALEQDAADDKEITQKSASIVLQILNSSQRMDDSVLLGALKLFGALIGKITWFWPTVSRDSAFAESIATGLQRLRDSSQTSSSATRQLAQSLLEAIFSG